MIKILLRQLKLLLGDLLSFFRFSKLVPKRLVLGQLLFLLRQLLKVFFLQQNSPHSAKYFLFPDDLSQRDDLMHQLWVFGIILFAVLSVLFASDICVTDCFDSLIKPSNFILNLLPNSFTHFISELTKAMLLFSDSLIFVEDSFVEFSANLLSYVPLHQVVVVLQSG